MPRPDFEKFKQLTHKQKIAENIIVKSILDDDAVYPFCKVCNTNYKVKERLWEDSDISYLWLDIFPMDGLSENQELNAKLYKKIRFYRNLLNVRILDKSMVKETANTKLRAFIKPLYKFLVDFIPTKIISKKIDKLSRKYNYSECEYVGGTMWGYGPQERLKKKDVEQIVKVEFENMQLDTFSCWDEYLHNLFGDYMTLPPIEKRKVHLTNVTKIN